MAPSTTPGSMDAPPGLPGTRADGWQRSPIAFLAAMALCGLGLASAGTTLVRVVSGPGLFPPSGHAPAPDSASRPPDVAQSAPEPSRAIVAATPSDIPSPPNASSTGGVTSSIPAPSDLVRGPGTATPGQNGAREGGGFPLPADAAGPERTRPRPQTSEPRQTEPRQTEPSRRASVEQPDATPRSTARERAPRESMRDLRTDRPSGREPGGQARQGRDGDRFERDSGMRRIAPPAGSGANVRAYAASPSDGRMDPSGARIVTLGVGNAR